MSKLLLIDDEESIVRVLSLSLRSDGYEVATAYNGEEGLKLFQQESPDIILTDIKMPGMDGLEVLKKVKELNPDTEVIVIRAEYRCDLIEFARRLLQFLHDSPELSLTDLAYTVNCPLQEQGCCLAIVANSLCDLEKKLSYACNRISDPRVADGLGHRGDPPLLRGDR